MGKVQEFERVAATLYVITQCMKCATKGEIITCCVFNMLLRIGTGRRSKIVRRGGKGMINAEVDADA